MLLEVEVRSFPDLVSAAAKIAAAIARTYTSHPDARRELVEKLT
jgi:hypothetical protein